MLAPHTGVFYSYLLPSVGLPNRYAAVRSIGKAPDVLWSRSCVAGGGLAVSVGNAHKSLRVMRLLLIVAIHAVER